MSESDTKSLTLTDGVVYDSLVLSENIALHIHKASAGRFTARKSAYEACIVTIGNKTDILTVGLIGVHQSGSFSKLPDLSLFQLSKREKSVRELLLSERIQHIGLILAAVLWTFQQKAPPLLVVLVHGIVSRSYIVIAQLLRSPEHFVELHMAVALYAWIGRSAAYVAVCELLHNVLAEIVLKVEYKMLEAKSVCNAPCILHVRQRTAGLALLLCLGYILIGKELQRYAHDFITSVTEQHCRYGAVHSSAHSYHYLFHLYAPLKTARANIVRPKLFVLSRPETSHRSRKAPLSCRCQPRQRGHRHRRP